LSAAGPGFEAPVPPGGYAWWYLDALSDDGRHGLCLIAFIGSVFSPYYAGARRRARRSSAAPADAYRHCALNVSLSGPGGRWAMTERPRSHVHADPAGLQIGASRLAWDGEALRIRIDETCSPLPRALRGELVLRPQLQPARRFALDPEAAHSWRPLAPRARVTVQLDAPRMAWDGEAYFDMNCGSRALEHDFHGWTWSRAATTTGARVHYEVQHRYAVCAPLALDFDTQGEVHRAPLPAHVRLPRSGWGIARSTRSDSPGEARVLRTLVDAPFYARSVVQAHFAGEPATCLHESLDLDRFRNRWVQAMLPFRMPRWPLR
jgi:carotenoid 1,2-hydratase